MRTRILLLIAAAGLVAGACNGSKGSASPRADAAAGAQSGDAGQTPGAGAQGATPTTNKTAGGTATTSKAKGNASTASSVAPAPAAGQPYTMDAFDRRAHVPPGAVPVVEGHSARAEWRLYVYRDDKKRTCLHFADQSAGLNSGGAGSGGAGGTCDQRPPLDPSTASGTGLGRWGYGLTTPQAVKVRFEHTGGAASETFDAVAAPGYTEHFYAGELLSQAPISRVVALDATGKVIAERTDTATLNISG